MSILIQITILWIETQEMVTEALIEIQELTLQEHLIAQTPLHIVQILV